MNQLKGQQEFLLGIDKEDQKKIKYDARQRRGSQEILQVKSTSVQDGFWADQRSTRPIRFSDFINTQKTQKGGHNPTNAKKTFANTKFMFKQTQQYYKGNAYFPESVMQQSHINQLAKQDLKFQAESLNSKSHQTQFLEESVTDSSFYDLRGLQFNSSQQKSVISDADINTVSEEQVISKKEEINTDNTFKSMVDEYLNRERLPLLSSLNQVEKLSQILRGHQDLTEPFLGPSKQVMKLKKRVRRAENARQASIENEKKSQIIGRRRSSNRITIQSQDSPNGSQDGSPKKDQRSQILVSTLKAEKKVKFKPTNNQNWETASRYSIELKNKSKQRLETILEPRKPLNRNQTFRNTRSVLSITQEERQMSKTFGNARLSQIANTNRTLKTTKAFYKYNMQQRKHYGSVLQRSHSPSSPLKIKSPYVITLKSEIKPSQSNELTHQNSKIDIQKMELSDMKPAANRITLNKSILFDSNLKDNLRRKSTRKGYEDQVYTLQHVSKESYPYSKLTSSIIQHDSQIYIGNSIQQSALSPLLEQTKGEQSDIQASNFRSNQHLFTNDSRTYSEQKMEILQEIVAMQEYGDRAIQEGHSASSEEEAQQFFDVLPQFQDQQKNNENVLNHQNTNESGESPNFRMEFRFSGKKPLNTQKGSPESKTDQDKNTNNLMSGQRSTLLLSKQDHVAAIISNEHLVQNRFRPYINHVQNELNKSTEPSHRPLKEVLQGLLLPGKSQSPKPKLDHSKMDLLSSQNSIQRDLNDEIKVHFYQVDEMPEMQILAVIEEKTMEHPSEGINAQQNEERPYEPIFDQVSRIPVHAIMNKTMVSMANKDARNNTLVCSGELRSNFQSERTNEVHRQSSLDTQDYQDQYGSIQALPNKFANESTMVRKSLGVNSIQTELLDLREKPRTQLYSAEENQRNFEDTKISGTKNLDDTAKHPKLLSTQEQFQMKTTIYNKIQTKSETKIPGSLPKAIAKVTAYRLPQLNGKGDLLEAVEKDMMNPNHQFKNLSQLFKEKQKEKFYAKNQHISDTFFRNANQKKKRTQTKRTVDMFPLEYDQEQKIVNLHFSSYSQHDYLKNISETDQENDLNKDIIPERESEQSKQNYISDATLYIPKENQKDENIGKLAQTQSKMLSTFGADGRILLQPSLPQADKKNKLSKQQKKLNALKNLKYQIQRKTEMSLLVHLNKKKYLFENDSLETDLKRSIIPEIQIMGTKGQNSIPQRHQGVGSKLFHTNSHLHDSTNNSKEVIERSTNGRAGSQKLLNQLDDKMPKVQMSSLRRVTQNPADQNNTLVIIKNANSRRSRLDSSNENSFLNKQRKNSLIFPSTNAYVSHRLINRNKSVDEQQEASQILITQMQTINKEEDVLIDPHRSGEPRSQMLNGTLKLDDFPEQNQSSQSNCFIPVQPINVVTKPKKSLAYSQFEKKGRKVGNRSSSVAHLTLQPIQIQKPIQQIQISQIPILIIENNQKPHHQLKSFRLASMRRNTQHNSPNVIV